MRRLWLIFAEFVTVTLAVVFVVTLVRPDWSPWRRNVVEIREAGPVATLLPASAGGMRPSYADAARKATQSVVNIAAARDARRLRHPLANDPLMRRFLQEQQDAPEDGDNAAEGMGSGVIVSSDSTGSYVLTNDHVVAGSDRIQIALADGRILPARVVGTDPESDLAVLRVEVKGLTPITLGQSDRAQVGDVVLAIGDPFGVGQTVTMGIISGLGRNRLGVNRYENFIQTDAAINPGNSGGALIDLGGNLIGINSVIYSRTGGSLGIGFAIPVSMAKGIMEQIIAEGSVTRGFIGINPQDVTPDLAESLKLSAARGALVAQVNRGGPADKGGLKSGDVIVAVDGKAIQDSIAAMAAIAAIKPGTHARFTVVRDQREVQVTVNVGRRPPPVRAR
ncbi:MAG: trypsin-like peptidase domain-containing protein [Betaproteobacteria bacterium]|nr:trypsin-like peptidase domain-containing protein [Betaproteobacteria bacterium]